MRKTLITVSIIVVLIGIGVFIYFRFFAYRASVSVVPGGAASFPTAETGATPSGNEVVESSTVSPRLVKISAGPVVYGVAAINTPPKEASSTESVAVRYIDRQSGNVYEYDDTKGTSQRINNQTVPGILSAAWLPNAETAFVRYLSGDDSSEINTYALPAKGVGSVPGGFFLPRDLADIAVSSTSILMLASGKDGSSGSIAMTDGSRSARVFSSPLSSVRSSFAGLDSFIVFTKPSAHFPGAAFLVKNGVFSRIAGPSSGLVALSNRSGSAVLISYVDGGNMRLGIVIAKTGEEIVLPVATIADKCAWSSDDTTVLCGVPLNPPRLNAYPDDWYQGVVSFSDRVWKINVKDRYAELALDFQKETGSTLDAVSLTTDPNNTALMFINKKDGSLWRFRL